MKSTFFVAALLFSLIGSPSSAPAQKSKNTVPAASPGVQAPEAGPTQREQRMRAYMLYLQARKYESQGDFPNAVNAYREITQLDPKAAAPHIALGELFFQNRNIKDAETEARAGVELEKENPLARRLLGQVLTAQGLSGVFDKAKVQEAIIQFLEVVRLDRADPDAYRTLGRLYQADGDNEKALDAYQKLLGSGVAGPNDYKIVSRMYFEKNRFRDAAQAARQAYVFSDNDPQLAYLLAQSLLRSGQTTEAVEVYQEIIAENPTNVGLILGYGEALMRAGKYSDAAQTVQKILNVDAANVEALSILAQTQRRTGKREEAVKILQQALNGQDVTDSLQLQFELAETLIELNRTDEGVKAYETALKALLNPDGTSGERNRRNVGVILRRIVAAYQGDKQSDKVAATLAHMKKLLGDSDTSADILRIDVLRQEGKHQEAAQAARDAQKRFPEEKQFKFLEAQSLVKTGETDRATGLLQTLLNGSNEDAEIHLITASILMEAGRLEDAEKSVRRALQYDEKNIDYLVMLSSIQDRRKMYKESETVLRQVLALDPDNPTALNNLGYFLAERNEKLDEALALVQRAVNIDPTNSSFLDSLGWVHFKLNQFEQARQYIEQAVGYDSRSATLHEHLGDVYEKLGKPDLARKKWQRAAELTNDHEEIARLKAKLAGEFGRKE